MNIDSESVKQSLSYLIQSIRQIKEIIIFISESSSNLDERIENPYSEVIKLLKQIVSRSNTIINLCNDFINDVERTSNNLKSIASSYDTEHANNNEELAIKPTDVIDNNIEVSNDSSSESRLLSEDQYQEIISFSEESFVDEEEDTEEYIKQIVLNSDYISEEDKNYICEQLDLGNIRAAIGRILVAQKKQQNEAIKEGLIPYLDDSEGFEAYTENPDHSYNFPELDINLNDIALGEEADYSSLSDEELISLFINSSDYRFTYHVIDLLSLEEFLRLKHLLETNPNIDRDHSLAYQWVRDAINNRTKEENKKYDLIIEQSECEIRNLEKECELWEYDYLVDVADDSDAELAKDVFSNLAQENRDNADSISRSGFSSGEAIDIASTYNQYMLTKKASYYDNLSEILSEDELSIFGYLYKYESEEAAYEYLSLLEPKINSYYGLQAAEDAFYDIIESDTSGKILADLTSGVYGVTIGTKEWFEVVANIGSETGTMTEAEYTVLYLNSMLGSVSYFIPLNQYDIEGLKEQGQITDATYDVLIEKNNNGERVTYLDILYLNGDLTNQEYEAFKALGEDEKIQDFIEKNNTEDGFMGMNHLEWLQKFFGAGVSVGNMLPSIAASVMTYGVASEVGIAATTANAFSKAAGLASMFVYCMSSDKNAALREGRSSYEAWVHGALSASSEVGTEILFDKLFSFIPGLPDFGMLPSGTKWKAIGKIALRLFALAPLGEITEEMVQYALLDPLADKVAYGVSDFEFNVNEAFDIALQTYISTFVTQFGSTVVTAPKIIKLSGSIYEIDLGTGQKIKVTYNELMSCYDENSGQVDAQKLRSILNEKIGVVLNVNGVEVGLTASEIESCKLPNGEIDYNKVDEIIKIKLQKINSDPDLSTGSYNNSQSSQQYAQNWLEKYYSKINKDSIVTALKYNLSEYGIRPKRVDEAVGKIAVYDGDGFCVEYRRRYPNTNQSDRVIKRIGGFHVPITDEIIINSDGYIGYNYDAVLTLTTNYIHELIHSFGNLPRNDYRLRGFNECLTQYYAYRIYISLFNCGDEYFFENDDCNYNDGTKQIIRIVDLDLKGLRNKDFAKAYFRKHDITKIDKILNKYLYGSNYTADDFYNALMIYTNPNADPLDAARAAHTLEKIYNYLSARSK